MIEARACSGELSNRRFAMRNNEQPVSRPALAKPGSFFETAVGNIRKYLLRRHLAHWHPISTAPNNQDLELRLVDQHRVVRSLFPCRRTNAGVWVNADLGTRLQIEPTAWRCWQKAAVPQAAFSASRKGPRPLLQGASTVRALGVILLIGAKWSVLPMSDRATSDRPLALIVAPRAAIGAKTLLRLEPACSSEYCKRTRSTCIEHHRAGGWQFGGNSATEQRQTAEMPR